MSLKQANNVAFATEVASRQRGRDHLALQQSSWRRRLNKLTNQNKWPNNDDFRLKRSSFQERLKLAYKFDKFISDFVCDKINRCGAGIFEKLKWTIRWLNINITRTENVNDNQNVSRLCPVLELSKNTIMNEAINKQSYCHNKSVDNDKLTIILKQSVFYWRSWANYNFSVAIWSSSIDNASLSMFLGGLER